MPVSEDLLAKRWLHAHEEDTTDMMVYRPATHGLPPSRGRTGFELRPDHTLIQIGIAPTDAPTESEGSWRLQEDDALVFSFGPDRTRERILKIKSAENDRLVVQK